MFTKQYYYFVTGLPNIGFEDSKAIYTPDGFLFDAEQKLSRSDMRLLRIMYLPQDIDNLLNLLYSRESTLRKDALIKPEEWQELIGYLKPNPDNEIRQKAPVMAVIPEFVVSLTRDLLSYEELPPFHKWESKFLKAFYEMVLAHSNSFIRAWFDFNRDIQNILIALNGRKYSHDYVEYLIGESDVVEKLSKSQAADFGMGKQYPLFEQVYRIFEQHNMIDRERSYDALRWRWIENQNFFEYFNIDRILGYFCQLRIIDRWINLDPDNGKEQFFDTLNALENSFSFPEEFDLKQKVKQ